MNKNNKYSMRVRNKYSPAKDLMIWEEEWKKKKERKETYLKNQKTNTIEKKDVDNIRNNLFNYLSIKEAKTQSEKEFCYLRTLCRYFKKPKVNKKNKSKKTKKY